MMQFESTINAYIFIQSLLTAMVRGAFFLGMIVLPWCIGFDWHKDNHNLLSQIRIKI